MTCDIIDSCISLCFRIMFNFCRYKYVSYKLTKGVGFFNVSEILMNLSPVVQETENLTRPDHEAWPLHLAYRNAIARNYVHDR